jgi:hypothetical protein
MRFGHASHAKLVELNKMFPSINVSKSSSPCDICFYAKQKCLPFPNSSTISANAFDIVHMDIWGPLSIPSILGFRYFLTVVDDKSHFTWLYFLKLKSEVSTYVKSFVSMIKTQYNITVKCIRSDNGPEFFLKEFYSEHGIIHQCSCVSTPQQNGIVERKHQHILGTAKALLFQSKLPNIFWAHAVGHAIHIINKLPTPFLSNKSPHQVLHNCLPDIEFLRVFGSLCYAHTLQHNRRKLDSRSRKCVYLGFRVGVKGHTLFDLQTREIFISRDVVFFEHIFPYHSQNANVSTSSAKSHDLSPFDDIHLSDSTHNHISDSTHNNTHSNTPSHQDASLVPTHSIHNPPILNDSEPHIENNASDNSSPNITQLIHSSTSTSDNHQIPLRKTTRITKPPPYLKDYHCNLVHNTVPIPSQLATTSSSSSKYPLSSYLSYHNLSSTHKNFVFNLSTITEPTCYEEAMKNEHWKSTINAELSALSENNTWILVNLPSDKKAIGCKWVFKLKLHVDGSVERYKAKLVEKGFTQTEGIDYLDTFSPVVKMTTVRVLMSIAASQNWPLFQLYVNTSFLHGDLSEEVYMKPPPGLHVPHPSLVCKLQRSLYGLKQASRQWNTKLTET